MNIFEAMKLLSLFFSGFFLFFALPTVKQYEMLDYRSTYLIVSLPGFLVKIGIAGDPAARTKAIDRSVRGSKEFRVLSLPGLFAERFEKDVLHLLFAGSRRTFKGSGKTEYFRMGPIRFVGAVVLILFWWAASLGVIISTGYYFAFFLVRSIQVI